MFWIWSLIVMLLWCLAALPVGVLLGRRLRDPNSATGDSLC